MLKKRKKLLTGASILLLMMGVLASGCASKQELLEKEEAYRKIGINAMEQEDFKGAIEAFNSALSQVKEIGANEIDICYYKAAAQFALGSFSDAIETYDTLLEFDRKNSDAYFLRGCVYLKLTESIQAGEDFKNAIKYAENDEIYLSVYNSLYGAGYETEAKAYLEEALRKKSGNKAENYAVKGKLYYLEKDYQAAAEQLAQAVEKGDVEANLYLAKAYEALGDDRQAEACLDAYTESNPDSSVACNQKGIKAMEAGRYQEAVNYFKQGLDLENVTNEQELRSNLIAAYEYSGDFAAAKEKMAEYVQDYPSDEAAAREYIFLGKNRNKETDTK